MPRTSTRDPVAEGEGRRKGRRAEDVASWYLRLNGFLAIPGFVVHLDTSYAQHGYDGHPRHARTEADFIAVRFPFSKEVIAGRAMQDDSALLDLSPQCTRPQFILVEVKAGQCRMNGPWTDPRAKNMQRVIRRLGVTAAESEIEVIAQSLYADALWEGPYASIQYICIGSEANLSLQSRHTGLVQVTWEHIGGFFHDRFTSFPEKLPSGHVHDQWPSFGQAYGRWFVRIGIRGDRSQSARAVASFVESGNLRSEA